MGIQIAGNAKKQVEHYRNFRGRNFHELEISANRGKSMCELALRLDKMLMQQKVLHEGSASANGDAWIYDLASKALKEEKEVLIAEINQELNRF